MQKRGKILNNNLLSTDQVVDEYNLKKPTVQNLCQKGKLPFIKTTYIPVVFFP